MAVEIRPMWAGDVSVLANRLRPADEEELYLTGFPSSYQAIAGSYSLSTHAWSGIIDGRLVACWGAAPYITARRTGIPWLLATRELDCQSTARTFLRCSRETLARMHAAYPVLKNWVWEGNRAAVRWLGWIGADIGPAEPFGPDRAPFRPFLLGR